MRHDLSMGDTASIVAAAAAVLAASLAGLGLIVGSRREDRQWARQVLLDAYVDFVELDMRGCSMARDLLRARAGMTMKLRGREVSEAEVWRAHNQCQEIMTRVRLLGGKASNDAMYTAHVVLDEYLAMLANPEVLDLAADLEEMLPKSVDAYEQLILNARRELGVRGAKNDRWPWKGDLSAGRAAPRVAVSPGQGPE